MDEIYFRDKAAMCLRLIQGLSPNNPGRFQLLELAKAFYWLRGNSNKLSRAVPMSRPSSAQSIAHRINGWR
jgi:hypothetical protein